MARSLLVRGMLAGLAAGVVAFVVARLYGEPSLAQAIALEGAHVHAGDVAPAGDGAAEPELFSRTVQSTVGLFTATTVYGLALGGIFGLVYGFAQGRVLRLGARGLALALAVGGFAAVYAVPFLKYPPNPPAVGDPDTIGRRTALYFTVVLVSVLLAGLALALVRRLEPAVGTWNAAVAGALAFSVAAALATWAMPTTVQEVGPDVPAVMLYRFRIGTFGIQLSLWLTLGLLFGALTEKAMRPAPVTGEARAGGVRAG